MIDDELIHKLVMIKTKEFLESKDDLSEEDLISKNIQPDYYIDQLVTRLNFYKHLYQKDISIDKERILNKVAQILPVFLLYRGDRNDSSSR